VFRKLLPQQTVLLTHGDSVSTPATGFLVVAKSANCIAGTNIFFSINKNFFSAIANVERKIYGLQFHPEVDLTVNGSDMMRNFLFSIAGCAGRLRICVFF
jgi:GMP synthase (glutamine-hydrolysing)